MAAPSDAKVLGALRPPLGVEPIFTNPPNCHVATWILLGICTTVTTICVLMRTYTKLYIIKQRELEDLFFIMVWAGFLAFMITISLYVPYGVGIHQWNVPLETMVPFAQRANTTELFYLVLILFLKLAILLQCVHIFAPTRSRIYWVLWSTMAITAVFYVFCIFFRVFACVPRAKIWDPSIPGVCADSSTALVVTAVFNAISDFVILCTPMSTVWQLQMPLSRKIGVSAVVATGLFGCISSVVRIVSSLQLIQTGDETYHILIVAFWSWAEITSGVFCGCLPVLPRFYRHITSRHVTSFFSALRSRSVFHQAYGSGITKTTTTQPWHSQALKHNYLELDGPRRARPTDGAGIPREATTYTKVVATHGVVDSNTRNFGDSRILRTVAVDIEHV